MKKDDIFLNFPEETPFEFNDTVASVFDDMIQRSVPFYNEIIKNQALLTTRFYKDNTMIYDLGCSSGNYASAVISVMKDRDFKLTAIDNSSPMIDLFIKRTTGFGSAGRIIPVVADIRDIIFGESSVVTANLTLQFIPPHDREGIIKRIYESLVPGGIFLLTEKTVNANSKLAELQQEIYYGFKERNGYSTIEITRKREALENVLIPETVECHQERLLNAGFDKIELWFKWYHFAAFLCVK
jgi:tRNA (cmo5U34)-methyltransferase